MIRLLLGSGDSMRSTTMRSLVPMILLVVSGLPACARADLMFFPATYDQEAYAKKPDRYRRVLLPPGSVRKEAFVERVPPTLTIPSAEVQAITAEVSQSAPELEGVRRELLRQHPEWDVAPSTAQEDYDITIVFNEQGAKALWGFAQAHNGELFELSLGGEHLTLVRFRASSAEVPKEFVLGLAPKETLVQLKKAYPQLRIR